MKRKILLLFCLFFFIQNIQSQRPQGAGGSVPKIKLSGRVIDLETQEPLEYTSITLVNNRFPDRIQGGITNDKGIFSFEIFPGKYTITIEYIGFKKITLEDQMIREDKDLGTITLEINAEDLDEVELIGERTEVEIRLDKRIYNVGRDLTVRGGSVADVLDNIPSVSVDVEGNVALRGNDNVRILINGKPSGLVGISGPQGLRQLPAESIEKVEVVTSPSARYEAEGTAGILNIILKKQELIGFNGNLSANIGLPETYRGSANLNWRTNKFNFFNTTTIGDNLTKGNSLSDNTYFNGAAPDTYLFEKSQRDRNRSSIFTNFGVEYYFNDKTSINLSAFYRDSDNYNDVTNKIREIDASDLLLSETERNEFEDEVDESIQYSANFFKDYDEDGHKLTATLQYESNAEVEDGDIRNQTLSPVPSPISYERTQSIEDQSRLIGQFDYVKPLKDDAQFELGYRGSFLKQETEFILEYLRNNDYILDTNLSNLFLYKEDVNAAYTQYGKKINKFSYLLGLRMERTKITVDQRTTTETNVRIYNSWFPTINLSYEMENSGSFQLGYSRRIRRPRSYFINPFPSRSSVTNIFQGNPYLDPTFSNALDLGYLKRWKKFTFNSSVYYQKSNRVFTFIAEDTGETVFLNQDPDNPLSTGVELPVIRRTPINLAENIRWGTEFNLSFFPSRKIRFNGNFNFFNSETIGDYDGISYDASNLSWFIRFNSAIKLPGNIDWQMRFFYRGPREDALNKSRGIASLSGAINKEVFKKKGTLSFRASDIFNSSKRISETFAPTFYSYSEFQWRQPTYILSLTYRINERKAERNRRRAQRNYGGGDEESFGF